MTPHHTRTSPAPPPFSQFRVVSGTAAVNAQGAGVLTLASHVPQAPPFELTLRAYATGAVRARIIEKGNMPPRWEVRRAAAVVARARLVLLLKT